MVQHHYKLRKKLAFMAKLQVAPVSLIETYRKYLLKFSI